MHDYLNKIFTTSGKTYALNKGLYNVNEVYVTGWKPGGSWSDTDYPSVSEGQFKMRNSTDNYVFVAHLYDSLFPAFADDFGKTVNGWFDFIESWDSSYGGTTDLKTLFNINFHSKTFEWNPSSYKINDLFYDYLAPAGGAALGKSGDWQERTGTDSNNHGFDLLFATLGGLNEDGTSNIGITVGHSNMGIAMGGYWICIGGFPVWPVMNLNIDHTTIHEVLHTYKAEDLSSSGYIMTGSGSWDNVMHSDTYDVVNHYQDRYYGDGNFDF